MVFAGRGMDMLRSARRLSLFLSKSDLIGIPVVERGAMMEVTLGRSVLAGRGVDEEVAAPREVSTLVGFRDRERLSDQEEIGLGGLGWKFRDSWEKGKDSVER